jgi:hypothetical protein
MFDGNGYFTIIFHGAEGAIRRFRHHLRPSRQVIGQAITDSDGRFQASVDLAAAEQPVAAWFDGSESYWPALAEASPDGRSLSAFEHDHGT